MLGATKKSRAKERLLFRTASHRWDPKISVQSCGTYTTVTSVQMKASAYFRCRIGPSWTFGNIRRENIAIVPLYFAAERPVVERDGLLLMVDDDRFRLQLTSRCVCRCAFAR